MLEERRSQTMPDRALGEGLQLTENLAKSVIRGAESWQFFAFIFAALVALALAMLDELPSRPWRIVTKLAAFAIIGYFTLVSPWGRNFLVGVLNWFKTEAH
jgi:hypothetical protein